MGLPIVQEIWDGIRWVIDVFLFRLPRSVQFLLFLVFLVLFGSLLSFFLHIGGVHCNSDKQVVKINFLDIGTNLAIIWEDSSRTITGENLTVCDVYPERCGSESECYFYAKKLDSGFYQLCNQTNSSSDCYYYLRDGNCHNCTQDDIRFEGTFLTYYSICTDDAYSFSEGYRENELIEWIRGCGSACSPPNYYYWNYTSGTYQCLDLDYCGINATKTLSPLIDEKLKNAGAVLLYKTTTEDKDYRSMVKIKCDNNYNPRLVVFGIDIFDYKIWLFFMVIYILVVLMFSLKK